MVGQVSRPARDVHVLLCDVCEFCSLIRPGSRIADLEAYATNRIPESSIPDFGIMTEGPDARPVAQPFYHPTLSGRPRSGRNCNAGALVPEFSCGHHISVPVAVPRRAGGGALFRLRTRDCGPDSGHLAAGL